MKYLIGIDIGGTTVKIGLLSHKGEILYVHHPTGGWEAYS